MNRTFKAVICRTMSAAILFSMALSISSCGNSDSGKPKKITKKSPWFNSNVYDIDCGADHNRKVDLRNIRLTLSGADDKYLVVYSTGSYDMSIAEMENGSDFEYFTLNVIDRKTMEVVNTIDLTKAPTMEIWQTIDKCPTKALTCVYTHEIRIELDEDNNRSVAYTIEKESGMSRFCCKFAKEKGTTNMRTIINIAMLCMLTPLLASAAIDRNAVVSRNNPVITKADTLASLSVGNGHFATTVDVRFRTWS